MRAIILIAALLPLAACTTPQRAATVGGASGAVIGGVLTNSVPGAIVGAAIGAGAGAVLGSVADKPGRCYFRDSKGRVYQDVCPR